VGPAGLKFLDWIVLPWLAAWGIYALLWPTLMHWARGHPGVLTEVGGIPVFTVLLLVPILAAPNMQRDRYLKEFHWIVSICIVGFLFLLNRLLTSASPATWPAESGLAHSLFGLAMFYAIYRLYWRKVYIDELTGIPNRRALDEKLVTLSGNYAIAMGDIDHFKKFNDTYGHDQGDHVLRFVATQLNEATRSRVFRYGGEEFCIVLENTSDDESRTVLEGARTSLSAREFVIRAPRSVLTQLRHGKKSRGTDDGKRVKVKITMSFGLDKSSGKGEPPNDVIKRADELLYKAKEGGRNRVVPGF
jgi:diguanylate cyclase (GGDEF)-like protein